MCVNMSLLCFLSLTTLPRKMVIEDGKFMIEGHYVPEETSIQKCFQTIGNKFSHSMNILLLTSRYHTFKVKQLQINLEMVIPIDTIHIEVYVPAQSNLDTKVSHWEK